MLVTLGNGKCVIPLVIVTPSMEELLSLPPVLPGAVVAMVNKQATKKLLVIRLELHQESLLVMLV